MNRRCQPAPLILALLLLASAAWAGPDISIPDDSFNFGKTVKHAVVTHTFWIHSTGDDTLQIYKVVPGCGCTKAPLLDSTLAPGDSTALEISFSTRSYVGYVTKRPFVETNAPSERTPMAIHSHILPNPDSALPLVINPARVDVSQFTELPRRKAEFLIQNLDDRPYDLELVDWSRDYFDVDLPGSVKPGETVTGEITVHEKRIPENFEKSLTFQINDTSGTRYSIPVKRMYRIKGGAAAGK